LWPLRGCVSVSVQMARTAPQFSSSRGMLALTGTDCRDELARAPCAARQGREGK